MMRVIRVKLLYVTKVEKYYAAVSDNSAAAIKIDWFIN